MGELEQLEQEGWRLEAGDPGQAADQVLETGRLVVESPEVAELGAPIRFEYVALPRSAVAPVAFTLRARQARTGMELAEESVRLEATLSEEDAAASVDAALSRLEAQVRLASRRIAAAAAAGPPRTEFGRVWSRVWSGFGIAEARAMDAMTLVRAIEGVGHVLVATEVLMMGALIAYLPAKYAVGALVKSRVLPKGKLIDRDHKFMNRWGKRFLGVTLAAWAAYAAAGGVARFARPADQVWADRSVPSIARMAESFDRQRAQLEARAGGLPQEKRINVIITNDRDLMPDSLVQAQVRRLDRYLPGTTRIHRVRSVREAGDALRVAGDEYIQSVWVIGLHGDGYTDPVVFNDPRTGKLEGVGEEYNSAITVQKDQREGRPPGASLDEVRSDQEELNLSSSVSDLKAELFGDPGFQPRYLPGVVIGFGNCVVIPGPKWGALQSWRRLDKLASALGVEEGWLYANYREGTFTDDFFNPLEVHNPQYRLTGMIQTALTPIARPAAKAMNQLVYSRGYFLGRDRGQGRDLVLQSGFARAREAWVEGRIAAEGSAADLEARARREDERERIAAMRRNLEERIERRNLSRDGRMIQIDGQASRGPWILPGAIQVASSESCLSRFRSSPGR